MEKSCGYCNDTTIWQLCLIRTWITIFFIPVIPYKRTYSIMCPRCNSYIEIDKEKFYELKAAIEIQRNRPPVNSSSFEPKANEVPDSIKYAGKNETQVEYLKCMEEARRREEEGL